MSDAMTPERLADIRERHRVGLGLERPGDVAALLAHVDHLTAENARLRAGIEDIEVKADDYGQQTLVNIAGDLLNQTEGDTDHE